MALFGLAVLIAALAQSLIFDSLAKTVNFDLKSNVPKLCMRVWSFLVPDRDIRLYAPGWHSGVARTTVERGTY